MSWADAPFLAHTARTFPLLLEHLRVLYPAPAAQRWGRGISDSVLSKHASALEAAGYVKIRKGYVGKRPRPWFSLTREGHAAYTGHVAALQAIVARSGLSVLPD